MLFDALSPSLLIPRLANIVAAEQTGYQRHQFGSATSFEAVATCLTDDDSPDLAVYDSCAVHHHSSDPGITIFPTVFTTWSETRALPGLAIVSALACGHQVALATIASGQSTKFTIPVVFSPTFTRAIPLPTSGNIAEYSSLTRPNTLVTCFDTDLHFLAQLLKTCSSNSAPHASSFILTQIYLYIAQFGMLFGPGAVELIGGLYLRAAEVEPNRVADDRHTEYFGAPGLTAPVVRVDCSICCISKTDFILHVSRLTDTSRRFSHSQWLAGWDSTTWGVSTAVIPIL